LEQFYAVTPSHLPVTRFYLEALYSCLTGCTTAISISQSNGSTVDTSTLMTAASVYCCGLAREASIAILRKAALDKFLDDRWLNSFALFRGKPNIIASMVEQSCLTSVASLGLDAGQGPSFYLETARPFIFRGDILPRWWRRPFNTFRARRCLKYIKALHLRVELSPV
jgi:hypothetical protein